MLTSYLIRPATKEELYNLRHASARNVVERVFGVLKMRWEILTRPPQFALSIQAQVPAGLAALHNFIMQHDPEDIETYITNTADDLDPNPGAMHEFNNYGALSTQAVTSAERTRATRHRDRIAQAMWTQYNDYLADNGMDVDD